MNRFKKAISVGMSAALLASLFTVIAAPAAFAATATGIVYGPNGSVAGSNVAASTTLAAFTPPTALAVGTTISLTLPAGTALASIADGDFLIQQIGGTATAPTGNTVVGTTITLTLAAASIGTTGNAVTVATSGTFTPGDIVNPTTAGSAYTFTVATQVGDSGTLTGVTFVAGTATTLALSPLTPTVPMGSTQQFTATCSDVNGNAQTCPATTWTTTAGTGTGTVSGTGLFTPTAVGTVTVTANAGAGPLTVATVVTVTAAPNSVLCSPVSGSTITPGTVVSCTETLGTAGAFVNWTTTNFTPSSSTTAPTMTFTAGATGAASIVATFSAGSPATVTSSYTVSTGGIGGGGTVTVTGALSVPRGNGYVSPTGATLTFTEGAIADFGTGFSFIVNIAPATPGAGSVSFNTTKAIVVVAPDSLGLTAKFLNAQQILVTSAPASGFTDNGNIEVFSIGGLQIKAASGTTLGAIKTTISGSTGSIADSYWASTTALATGLLQANYSAGAGPVSVLQTSTCGFALTGGVSGTLNFASNPESVNITAGPGSHVLNDVYNLTISAMTLSHGSGTSVSQTVANCAATGTISSIGSVVDALLLTADILGVQAGLNNQPAGNVYIAEQAAGFIPASTVCTLAISEPGVLFSSAANVSASGGGLATGTVANLSFDRKSLSFSTTATSTVNPGGVITVTGIKYDVDATATLGDAVMVTVTCGALLIAPTSIQNAFINNAITQVAAAPTVFIGYNDQQSGMLSITESQSGFFGSLGGGNTFTVCLDGTDGATFTRAPWAVVSTGDVKLLNPASGTGVSQLAGTLSSNFLCATWTVYSASTVASTIDIRGSDAAGAVLAAGPLNGPRYNIASTAAPGPVRINLAGSSTAGSTNFGTQVNAIKAFKNGVAVAAVSQPFVAPGGLNQPAGNLTISETLNGQFVTGEQIACRVLNSAFNLNNQVFLSTAISNDLPVVSTNTTTGLIAHLVGTSTFSNSFTLMVDQPAFAPGLGVITVSNLHYTVVSDAVHGPVFVECSNKLSTGAGFDAFVSNAIVGAQAIGLGLAATRLGVTQVGAFTISTKIPKVHKYVTYRFDFGVKGAGQIVQIWGATKTGNDWSAFTVVTSRRANASGVVYYYIRQNSATWKSYRANWSANNAWTPARQARWIP